MAHQSAFAVNGSRDAEPAWADQKWMRRTVVRTRSVSPATSAAGQRQGRGCGACRNDSPRDPPSLVFATRAFALGRGKDQVESRMSPIHRMSSSGDHPRPILRQIEQRGDGGDGQGAWESKMGKPVRKTLQSGLRPSAIAMHPKTGLMVREVTLVSGTHTATPDTKTVCGNL